MAGGALFSFLYAEDMAVEGRDSRAPVVDHVIGVDGKPWAFETAVWPEEPGHIGLQVCVDGTTGEVKVSFHELGIVFGPKLQGFGTDFGGIGVKGSAAKLDGDISPQGVTGSFWIITAVVGCYDSFVPALDNAVSGAQIDNLTCLDSLWQCCDT